MWEMQAGGSFHVATLAPGALPHEAHLFTSGRRSRTVAGPEDTCHRVCGAWGRGCGLKRMVAAASRGGTASGALVLLETAV